MSLSYGERKRLEEIEKGIDIEDPVFARKLRAGIPGHSATPPSWPCALLLFAGVLILLIGIATQFIPISMSGFLLMIAGGYEVHREPDRLNNSQRPRTIKFMPTIRDERK